MLAFSPKQPIQMHFGEPVNRGQRAANFSTVSQLENILLQGMNAQGDLMKPMSQQTLHDFLPQSGPKKCWVWVELLLFFGMQ
jgi:hypothetical protein